MILNRRGSTSVLVILVIIVLATFGGVAVTSSWINMNLAAKNVAWNEEYYEREMQAEYMLAWIDSALIDARDQAAAYFTDGYFAEGKIPPGIPPSLIGEDFREAAADGTSRELTVQTLFTRLYYYHAAVNLETLAGMYPIAIDIAGGHADRFLDMGAGIPGAGDLTVSYSVAGGMDPGDLSLDVAMDVLSPGFSLGMPEGDDWRDILSFDFGDAQTRLRITRWNTAQVPLPGGDEADFSAGG
jgi:hypothetical protein